MYIRMNLNGIRVCKLLKYNLKNFTLNNKPNLSLKEISKNYWSNKERNSDLDSMCGFKELNSEDIVHSKNIIPNRTYLRALDVGSGVGRITFNVLYDMCEEIDLLDINKNFLEIAKKTEQEKINFSLKKPKIKNYYDSEIQLFKFAKNYDLVFIQWVLEYLDDKELKVFLEDTNKHLNENGCVIIKENVNLESENNLIYLNEGSSIRSDKRFEKIFESCGFIIKSSNIVEFKSVDDLCDIKYWLLTTNKI